MTDNKTQPNDADPEVFLDAVTPDVRRIDARRLDTLFRQATGYSAVLWGDSILGYGRYCYTYASGRKGQFLATGFAPRKRELVLYIMPGYADFGPILDRLGPHRKGKSCLYLTRMDRVNETALADLIRAGLTDLARHWPVTAD